MGYPVQHECARVLFEILDILSAINKPKYRFAWSPVRAAMRLTGRSLAGSTSSR